jgi:ubiquitin-protein ligase E3 C
VLQELPFVVPFKERVQILESFFAYDPFNVTDRSYRIRIRRDYLYEDALDNLSLENAPNLKTSRISVEMINKFGADEAGIDGGGLFREFMLNLLETGFDPNRGFFILTSDGFLYPNPNVRLLVESYHQHYFFLGRMLAKAIQSKILSELKFADFFLQKILTKYSDTRLDIDYLASLDPVVYKNLLYLKDLKHGNVEDLGLNFSVDTNEFGETRTVELKPDGRDIPVTNDNKIEYIHLLADFKLNKQINEQVLAFRNGMSNVIDLEYLRLFNFHELESLISGTVEVIDVADWRRYTVYSGEYNENHPAIQTFWEVVDDFDEDNKRKLLKFATSRSRPPLFGFKNLIPNFAIHNSGSEDRLPSASTCLHLLKLPPITDYIVLKTKLICAIEADAGFELS